MAVVTIAFSDLDTWLSNQPVNTADNPYELNVTGLTRADIERSDIVGSFGYVLKSHNDKYVDLSETELPNVGTRYGLDYVFQNCTGIVSAPKLSSDTENLIGTFYNCTSLINTPVIPDSVIYITEAFLNCTSLVNAPVLPDNLYSMKNAFNGCTSLENPPLIPANVPASEMNYAFKNCTSLAYKPLVPSSVASSVYSGVTQTAWGIPQSDIDAWIEEQTTEFEAKGIVLNTQENHYEVVKDSDLIDISYYGVDISNLQTWRPSFERYYGQIVKILGLTTSNARDIKDILFRNPTEFDLSITKIPEGTDCVKLFSFDSSFTYVDNLFVPPVMPTDCTDMSYTFKSCHHLRTPPVIPSGVTTIECCFSNCYYLTVPPVIPNGITSMVKAFYRCDYLESIPVIPSSVINMEEAFYDAGDEAQNNKKGTAVVNIPNGVLNINSAFRNCYLLKEVECIPSSVTTAKNAFSSCYYLKKIDRLELPLSTLDNADFEGIFTASITEIGYKPDESDQWHAFRLKINSDSVEGEIFDVNGNSTDINEGTAVSITKSTLTLPIKTDEMWFPNMADPNFNTDAKIDAVIEKVLQNKYSYFKKTALPPNEKSFVLWADNPSNVMSNILGNQTAFDSVHPIGEVYVQFPHEKDPMTLYNVNGITSTWTVLDFGGAFFRAEGGNALTFDGNEKAITAVSGSTITIASHGASVGTVIYDYENNESRVVTAVSGNVLTLNSQFTSTNLRNVLISQSSSNLEHDHGSKTGETQPSFSGTNVNVSAGSYKPAMRAISSPFTAGSYIGSNYMTNGSTNETRQMNFNYTPKGSVSSHNHSITKEGGTESRPVDFTYKIWKRTS